MKHVFFLISIACLITDSRAQKLSRSEKISLQYMQKHLGVLAHDSLKGRRAGTPGEQKASRYLSEQFLKYGLEPKGDHGSFLQSFSIPDGKRISHDSYVKIQDRSFLLTSDYIPLSITGNGQVQSKSVMVGVREKGQPWFLDVSPTQKENAQNPHFDLNGYLLEQSENARKKGATAVLWYQSDISSGVQPGFDPKYNGNILDIPVVYLTQKAQDNLRFANEQSYDISIHIEVAKSFRTASNVIGYLDRSASQTIIIGAHFDHLGYGEDGNSMIRTGVTAIHNGADDNASGTSSLLELARIYSKDKKFNAYNLLFIAFSGEELGLLGSRYFTEKPSIDLRSVNFMINMDMVGRLHDSSRSMTLGGYGTSPQWQSILDKADKKRISLRYDSSGTGPSDHTSFYRKDIPVLFFFTGLHTDYHKPTDDMEKINTAGMVSIIGLIQNIIQSSNPTKKLVFSKTREQQTSTTARFTVSLGIMPDYSYSGNGVRIDGVSEGKVAKKAGIMAGDILILLGDNKVTSVESYMQSLSKFKKGDSTQVTITRNGVSYSYDIIF
jgi:aminopeptidase YwaD